VKRIRCFFAFVLLFAALVPASVEAAPAGQFRAYWVDAFGPGLFTPAEIDEVVADTKAANMNAIIAQVVRRADCLCNRSVAPRTEAPIAPLPFDPLQTLIDKAHAQGIEVHAWMIVTGFWKGGGPPIDPNHRFNLHGIAASGANSWVNLRSDGTDRLTDEFLLDVGHPDAAQYVLDVAMSILANYDVDGLNLDRIRNPDGNLATNLPSWGYNPTAVARFQAAKGRGDRPPPGDPEWTQWRRDQITGLVRKIYLQSYALKPHVRVSADTIVYGGGPQGTGGWEQTRTYREQLQDWRGWLAEGILDLNIIMNYKRDDFPNQAKWFAEWSHFTKDNQGRRAGAVGTALYLNDIPGSIRQVRGAVAPSAQGNTGAGWVGFSYRTPRVPASAGGKSGAESRAELTRALTQPSVHDLIAPAVFASAAPVPPMPWKVQPTTGHVSGTALDALGAPLVDRRVELADPASGAVLRAQTTDASGWFGFVDLEPRSYRVSSGETATTVSVLAGKLQTLLLFPRECRASYGPWNGSASSVPSGLPGFHAAWYGQSGHATVCPGGRVKATVAFANSGSRGWGAGTYLGTWDPDPGQDKATLLGGDGQRASPNTGWPSYNRTAAPTTSLVAPSQVGWFEFNLAAPTVPGTYRISVRPVIEGVTWMEDYGVFWQVTVK
jgi:uncharacterized lipoprotein YddW (UPF0748 family)